MVRRAQTKTTAPLQQKVSVFGEASGHAQAGGEGVRRGGSGGGRGCKWKNKKCTEIAKTCTVESHFWYGSCQPLHCQYLHTVTQSDDKQMLLTHDQNVCFITLLAQLFMQQLLLYELKCQKHLCPGAQ